MSTVATGGENISNRMDGDDDLEMSPAVGKMKAGSSGDDSTSKKRKKAGSGKALAATGSGATGNKSSGSKKARKSAGGRDPDEFDAEESGDEQDDDMEMDLDAAGQYDEEDDENIEDIKKAGGIIEKIYVENFMNHKKMEVNFNSTLTFITGKNGSGKSAIATALMICLGSRASTTGRGSALKGLIMEGSNGNAKIQVSLRNVGIDAYEPHLYGKTIVIERTITRSGGSSLALKNGSKKSATISTKRADLDRLLSRFDIRVENPCCVLTQEQSKKFIKGREEDKYDFFMKATGLKPMYDELLDLKDTYDDSNKTFQKSEGRVEQLREDKNAKKRELQSLLEMDGIEQKIRECQAKAFWIDVYEQQAVLTGIQERSDEQEEDAKKAKEELAAEEEAVASAGSNKVQLKAELEEAISGVRALEDGMEESNKAYSDAVKKKKTATKLEKECQAKISEWEDRKAQTLEELDEMRSKAMGNADEDRKILYEKRSKLEHDEKKIHSEITAIEEELQEAEQASRDQQKDLQRYLRAHDVLRKELKGMEADLSSIRSSGASDEMAKFTMINQKSGKQLHTAFKAIQADAQLRGKLVGPIGALLSLKSEYKKFSSAVHVALSGLEGAFVNVSGDMKVMHRGMDLLRSKGVRAEIINQPRASRYRVPTPQYNDGNPTLIETLNIDHEDPAVCDLIFNVLVDRKRAQGTLIVPAEDRDISQYICRGADGKDKFKDGSHISCIAADSCATVSFTRGVRSTIPYKPTPKKYLTASDNSGDAIKDIEDGINAKKAEIREHESTKPQGVSNNGLERSKSAMATLSSKLRGVNKSKKQIDREIADFEDNNKEEDTTELENMLTQLDAGLDQAAHEREKRKEAIKEVAAEVARLKEVVGKMEQEKEELAKTRDEKEEQLKVEMNRSRDAENRIHRLRKNAESKEKKAAVLKTTLEKQSAEYEALEKSVKAKTAEILGDTWDGEPLALEKSESREKLKKKATKLKATLERQREENEVSGLTLDIAQARYCAAKEAYQDAKASRIALEDQLKKLSEDIDKRKTAYRVHRKACAARVNKMFCSYLAKKGFSGLANFEHPEQGDNGKQTKGKLNMMVNKDGGEVEEGSSDIRNLSGGERSFTTLALLLALGHVIDTPFRVMDEYDVFLDELSRTLTLQQIQDYAKDVKQAKKQFVIITPNSLKGIRTGNSTKVVKMADPERRQAHGLQQQTID
jgi:chromosome segregation ATPase